MIKFFKDYFIFSHQIDGYTFHNITGSVKISKKQRIICLIVSYIILIASFLIFKIPLDFGRKLFLWLGIIAVPTSLIFKFDYRVIKILRLYCYSKSKNINKRIIYEGYRFNNYRRRFLKVFSDFGTGKIWDDYTSYSYQLHCFWKNNHLFVKIKPHKVIIKFNDKKEIIRKNSLPFRELLQQIKEKCKV